MGQYQLPQWLQAAVAASGGLGLFLLALLDSTFLPFPTANDLLLINLCLASPGRMPYYAGMATLGSVLGSLLLYMAARKGGEVAFHKGAGKRAKKIRHWMERKGFLTMVVASLLPPPTPFKLFILAAGALGMPLRQFVLALAFARSARFYGEGYLAARYGVQAARFLADHKLEFLGITLGVVLLLYAVTRLVFRHPPGQESQTQD